MEQAFEELLKASPLAAAIVIVVLYFLRQSGRQAELTKELTGELLMHLREETESRKRLEEKREQMLLQIGDKCHAVQQRAIERLDRNTEMLGRTNQALGRIENVVQRHPSRSEA